MKLYLFENRTIEITLFTYSLSLILFAQIPAYSFISVLIGMLLVLEYSFFSFIYKKDFLFMNSMLYAYLIFYIFSMASIFWATDSNLSLIMIVRMTYLLILIITIYSILKKYAVDSSIHYGIIVGILFNFIVYLDIIHLPIETWLWSRFQGTTENPNVLAIVSVFSIFSSIILLYLHKYSKMIRYMHIGNIGISIFLVLATASKKGIIFGGLLLILLLLFSKNKFKLMAYIVGFTAIVVVIITQFFDVDILLEKISFGLIRLERFFEIISGGQTDTSSADRLTLVIKGFNKFADHPFFGYGIDNFRHYFNFYAHNNYIELLFDVGIIGSLIYYSMYIILINKSMKIKDTFLKYMIVSLLFIILAMDIALVSYFYKFLLTYVVLVSYYIDKYNKSTRRQKDDI